MQRRTIRIIRSLTHAGRKIEPGAQLVIDERRAVWLIDQGVALATEDWVPERAALLTPPATMQTRAARAKAAPMRTGCCGQRTR